jgi:cytochrome P450
VVRTAPNELSFSSATSWKDIYPSRKGHKVFIKSKVYDVAAFVGESRSIVNEQDPAVHAKMRKTVAPAFSERSLREAHPLVMEVTDNFINEVRRRRGSTFDLTQWFSLVTFDLATTLALGECFDTVKAGKTHPWAVFFMNGVKAIGDAEFLRRFPLLKRLVLAFPPPQMRKMRKELNLHEEFCRAQIKKWVTSFRSWLWTC